MKIYFIRLTQTAYNFQKYCYYTRVKRYGALDFDFNFSFGWKNEAAKFWTLKVVVNRKYFPLEHQTNFGKSIFGITTTYKELEQLNDHTYRIIHIGLCLSLLIFCQTKSDSQHR